MTIPGFVDAHCHAFQRRLRGRAPGGDFWAWRDAMIELAATLTVTEIRAEYAATYRELRAAGYTAVGEFHYLGLDEARAAAEAAAEAGESSSYTSSTPENSGTLASDEALAALREKLAGR
jgi:cytosine/adenosine deaminase-related metal-dependent hydrolase